MSVEENNQRFPYIIWWNDETYEIDPDLFEKMSRKFKAERASNPNQMTIEEKMPKETFFAFIAACQLKPFDVNKKNAYKLLKLSIQWDVPSLKAFVEKFIETNKVEPPQKPDYIQILLEKIAKDKDSRSDWANVAEHINKALEDPRFVLIPTEIIFQILSIADKKSLRQKSLISFVLRMLNSKPEIAIPLILRIDFEQMTPEEIDQVYNCPLLHELNINFFSAASVSAVSNKASIAIQNAEKRDEIELKSLEYSLKKFNEHRLDSLASKYNEEIEEIMDEISRQQEIIDKLNERVRDHQNRMSIAEQKVTSRRVPLDIESLQEMQDSINYEIAQMTEEVNSALNEHQVQMGDFESVSATAADSFFNKNAIEGETEITRLKSSLRHVVKASKRVSDKKSLVEDDLTQVRAVFCAKILRDKLRYDQFLRKTANRFRIFDKEPRIWGLSSTAVKDAEEYMKNIDRRLDEYCPMRTQQRVGAEMPNV